MLGDFDELGYRGPLSILSSDSCRRLGAMIREPNFPPPLDWVKGHAVTSRAIYDIAVSPPILDIVSELLGSNILLWGATILERPSGSIHPWHSDMESSVEGVRGVSVWLGLEHTSTESSLQFISRSHRLGPMVQDLRNEQNVDRHEATTERVLGWARELDPRCEFQKPAACDGQAIFFDGRLWHYSENRSSQSRIAILLQYATADIPLQSPDYSYLDRPFRNYTKPQPPCLLVRGEAPSGVNRIVQPPAQLSSGQNVLVRGSRICELELPLATDPTSGFRKFPIFGGQTGDLRNITCHVSSLTSDSCPHAPHQHSEEEILLVLDGELELVLPDLQNTQRADQPFAGQNYGVIDSNNPCRRTLRRGEFVYYPSQFTHTLINTGSRPANYLMFRWHAISSLSPTPLLFGQYDALRPHVMADHSTGFSPELFFEGPTAWLRKLHCHVTCLAPGKGYAPHHDSYDVGIIVLEGEVETLGARVGPNSVIFYPAGELHGMFNPGDMTARYIVFEFHGSQRANADLPDTPPTPPESTVSVQQPAAPPVPPPTFLTKLRDPQRWKRKLGHWSRRIIR